jgi:hypothetical protein
VGTVGAAPRVDIDLTGPLVGAQLGTASRTILDRYSDPTVDSVALTFFAGSCLSCVDRARDIVTQLPIDPARELFMVSDDARTGGMLRDLLASSGAPVIDGDDARVLLDELKITATPFAVVIGEGAILAKKYIDSIASYEAMRSLVVADSESRLTLQEG